MNRILTTLVLAVTSLVCFSQAEGDNFEFDLEQIKIPYQQFTLENGLTLIVHEDNKAPIVAVNIWYHVGSKDEPAGRTGFAHLFEHLMFNGSENYNTDYFQALESIGATDLNGTTNFDRTNYFQNVPTSALDVVLWMESDRMGHFSGAISQERLDEQRGVVQNEKRQGEDQPYGKWFGTMLGDVFPANHPYSHSIIGSMDDLNAAALEDVKKWFADYYGPSNAVLVIAGDVNSNDVLEKVQKYFGDIPPGPPVTHLQEYIAKRTGEIRKVQYDRVPQTRVMMQWNVPAYGDEDAFLLDFVSSALTSGKKSRLYNRLVYDEQIATSVNSFNWELEVAGMFIIQANVKPGVDKMVVENAIREELSNLLEEGVTQQEILRTKTQYFANLVRGMERVGGFGGKSDLFAQNYTYMGDPEAYLLRAAAMRDAKAADINATAKKWLSDGAYVMHIEPFPEYRATGEGADRSKLPDLGATASVSFPELQRAELDNGIKIILAQRETIPLIEFRLAFDAGYAADQFAQPGTASLAMNMMDEGTTDRDALQISEELSLLGAQLWAGSNLDQSFVTMSALKNNLEASMDLFADVVLNPSFPEPELERLKKQQIVGIQQEKNSPVQMALRTLPKFLYGPDHAYGNPLTGSGYEETVSAMTTEDMKKFHSAWIRPNNATFIAVGDVTMDELKGLIEKSFKKWKEGDIPEKNLAPVAKSTDPKIYLMDRPNSEQTVVIASQLIHPYGEEDEVILGMSNEILGGKFTSRINMNIREDKGWAYGARSLIVSAKGQQPFLAYAPVQTDKTAPSMAEIVKEIQGYVTDNPATAEEFEMTKTNEVMSLPGKWETLNSVESALNTMVQYDLDPNYYKEYSDRIQNMTLDQIQDIARKVIKTEGWSWMVVGDKAKIEKEIMELGYGEVIPIDSDGNILSPGEESIGRIDR